VIPDYYAKAADYDREIDQAAKNRALGWHVDVRRGLEVTVHDARGEALRGARVEATARSRADGKSITLVLVERDGRYVAAHQSRGIEDLAITIERGDERVTARATLE
jgi:nitrogen fixation protein FixH